MPDTSLTPSSPAAKQSALLCILKATATLPAQVMFYASALGAIALIPEADVPTTLVGVAGGIGVNILSSIIERVAQGEDASSKDILEKVEAAVAESGIDQMLTSNEFQRAIGRLARWKDLIEYAIHRNELNIVEHLVKQTQHYTVLHDRISADLRTLATREQGDEILTRIRHLESRLFDDQHVYTRHNREGASDKELLAELKEWKLVHKHLQDLIDKLLRVLNYLKIYRSTNDGTQLDAAGSEWQTSCQRGIKVIRYKWGNFRFAGGPGLDELREYASEFNIKDITRRLRPTEVKQKELESINSDLLDFNETCWAVLTIANEEIIELVDIVGNGVTEP